MYVHTFKLPLGVLVGSWLMVIIVKNKYKQLQKALLAYKASYNLSYRQLILPCLLWQFPM